MKGNAHEHSKHTPENLGDLYPHAKTYDEVQDETEQRQEKYLLQHTSVPSFKVAFFSTFLLAVSVYYVANTEILFLIRDSYVQVFTYAIWIIIGVFWLIWLRYGVRIFREYQRPYWLFLLPYVCIVAAAFAVRYYKIWVATDEYQWLLVLSAYNFILCYIALKCFLHRKKEPATVDSEPISA